MDERGIRRIRRERLKRDIEIELRNREKEGPDLKHVRNQGMMLCPECTRRVYLKHKNLNKHLAKCHKGLKPP